MTTQSYILSCSCMPPTFTSRDAENLWKCCFANIDAQSDTIKHWEKNCISYKQSIRTKQYKVKRSLFRYSQFQVYGFSLPSQAATSREISCATLYIHIAVLKAVSERSSARYSWSRFDVSMASTKSNCDLMSASGMFAKHRKERQFCPSVNRFIVDRSVASANVLSNDAIFFSFPRMHPSTAQGILRLSPSHWTCKR